MAFPGLASALGIQQRVTFKTSTGTIFAIDATLSEQHGRESPATEFEVEDGTGINDDIIIKPFTLDLVGVISDTPIDTLDALTNAVALAAIPTGVIQAAAAAASVAGEALQATGVSLASIIPNVASPSAQAYAQLLQIQGQKLGLEVQTTLKRYVNMYIVGLTAPRDVQRGNILEFTLKLQELRLVQAQSVNIAVLSNPDVGAGQGKLGGQQTTDGDQLSGAAQSGFNDGVAKEVGSIHNPLANAGLVTPVSPVP